MRQSPHALVILVTFLLVTGGYVLMAFHFPIAYIWATYEDLVGEWSQTYFFLAAAVLGAGVAFQKSRYRGFFAVLALACTYVVLEEISWGQRIFGFATPEFLKAKNLQGEANLHNVFTGPYKTALKDFLSLSLAVGLAGYGLLYPLLLRLQRRSALWLDGAGIAAPPFGLWPLFTLAAVFELKPLTFNEAEIAELLVAMALAVTSLHYFVAGRRWTSSVYDQAMSRNDSLILSRWLITLFVTVLVLAGFTTKALYASPDMRAAIDGRIDRGIEKFAGRYVRYGRCDIANQLYARLLAAQSDRVSLLRSMARCYQRLGQDEQFHEYVNRAIAVDLGVYESEPWRASVNQSLVRSYRLAGMHDEAERHLAEALEIGLRRVAEHPDSDKAAYSLGRTLLLADRRPEARDQFTRAYELDPTSKKYRRAYYSARQWE